MSPVLRRHPIYVASRYVAKILRRRLYVAASLHRQIYVTDNLNRQNRPKNRPKNRPNLT